MDNQYDYQHGLVGATRDEEITILRGLGKLTEYADYIAKRQARRRAEVLADPASSSLRQPPRNPMIVSMSEESAFRLLSLLTIDYREAPQELSQALVALPPFLVLDPELPPPYEPPLLSVLTRAQEAFEAMSSLADDGHQQPVSWRCRNGARVAPFDYPGVQAQNQFLRSLVLDAAVGIQRVPAGDQSDPVTAAVDRVNRIHAALRVERGLADTLLFGAPHPYLLICFYAKKNFGNFTSTLKPFAGSPVCFIEYTPTERSSRVT